MRSTSFVLIKEFIGALRRNMLHIFGGLWETAAKSLKHHFWRIVGNICITFEELAMILAEVEACLNYRPLTPLPQLEDGIEVLTPGHFLIG